MRRLAIPAMLFAGMPAAGAVAPLGAQALRGSVVDSVRSIPLDSAFFELLAPDSQIVAYGTTNNGGRFYVRAPAPGFYRLRVRRVGYGGFLSEPLALETSRDKALHVRLAPLAVELEPLAVVTPAASRFLENVGFYDRKRSTTGFFLDPEQTTKMATRARQTVDVLDGIPGVTIAVAGGSWGVRRPFLTRQIGCGEIGPRIYVDNIMVTAGDVPFDLNTVNPNDLLAIEIYDSVSEVPLQYGGTQATCGVLMLWTRR